MFKYRTPNEKSLQQMEQVRQKCQELLEVLCTLNSSREKSLAITKLEETAMWANKATVFNQDNINPTKIN